MGHYKIFEDDHKFDNHYPMKRHHYSRDNHYSNYIPFYPASISLHGRNNLRNILSGRKIWVVLLITAAIVIGLLIMLVILVFPLLKGIVDTIMQDGLKGIVESITGLISRIWNGS